MEDVTISEYKRMVMSMSDSEYQAMVVKRRAMVKKWRVKNRKKLMAIHRMVKFGLLPRQYEAMLANQGGKCAICGNPETVMRNGVLKALAVDHDRETGRVRSLLCQHCNTSLGMFKDSRELLLRAVKYLDSFSDGGKCA